MSFPSNDVQGDESRTVSIANQPHETEQRPAGKILDQSQKMQLQGNQGSFLKLHANTGSTKAATKFDCGGSTDDGRKGEGGAITASRQNQMMKLPQMNSTPAAR